MVVIFAERAANERRANAGQRFDLIVAGIHVRNDRVSREGVEMVVRVGVIHQLVAAFDDGFRLLGVLIRPVAHDEKGARYAVLAQHVKNFLCVVRAPGCIERDGADLLVALHTVDGQLPRCSRCADSGRIIDGGEDRRRGQPRCGQRQPFALENEKARRLSFRFLCPVAFEMKKHQHILPRFFW